jgi:hypothetical protein
MQSVEPRIHAGHGEHLHERRKGVFAKRQGQVTGETVSVDHIQPLVVAVGPYEVVMMKVMMMVMVMMMMLMMVMLAMRRRTTRMMMDGHIIVGSCGPLL